MIYFLMFYITGIALDFKSLLNGNKKQDKIFYIVFMVLALIFAIYYYINQSRPGIAEWVLNVLGKENV